MKAEEKKLLYTFFKTSTDYFCGYTTQEQIPVFNDLEEHPAVSAKAAAPLQRALSDGRFESGEYAAAARNGGRLPVRNCKNSTKKFVPALAAAFAAKEKMRCLARVRPNFPPLTLKSMLW